MLRLLVLQPAVWTHRFHIGRLVYLIYYRTIFTINRFTCTPCITW